ncbi:hypothetical protein [Fusobacterium sp.]|uniref:hypothetical protein n=1 Tax=Fusobacterium sp. TaxID=68766 RepID=UPI0026336278|nr:hypothetical protein [Fusobacterium sp.]
MIKRKLLFSIFLLMILVACKSIKSNEEISLTRIEGRNRLVVNYDKNRYQVVKLDDIVIDSGREYYVKSKKYLLSYKETSFITGYLGVSEKEDRRGSRDIVMPTRKIVEITEDMEINLKNHNVQLNFSGKINSGEKF